MEDLQRRLVDAETKDKLIDCVLQEIAENDPQEFVLTPEGRWRLYAGITIDILNIGTFPASIDRFVAVCNAMKTGFTIASKDPPDLFLEVRGWVQYGFRILAANPKSTDWSVVDRDDSAITDEDKAKMLYNLFPLLRAMLGWANKAEPPPGTPPDPLPELRTEVIRQLKMRNADYWESAMTTKLFDTDRVTGLSSYNTSLFNLFLFQLAHPEPDAGVSPLPKPTVEVITKRILADLHNSAFMRDRLQLRTDSEESFAKAIKRERAKQNVEKIDFDGLTAAVTDALSDNPSGEGLTMKMCEDLERAVTHDWMVSVTSEAGNFMVENFRTIFTPEETAKHEKLIAAIKDGFQNRALKAETKETAAEWQRAANIMGNSKRREKLSKKEWNALLTLIVNRRKIPTSAIFPLNMLTRGTKEYNTLHRNLDDLIKKIAAFLPQHPSYTKEYLDFLVGFRDGTLSQHDMTMLATLKGHGLVLNQEDADHALETLKFNIEFYNNRLKASCDRFEEAGRKGGKDLLGRFALIQPEGIANGLYVFDPRISTEIIIRTAYALHLFRDYGHAETLHEILQSVEAGWERFFDVVILAAPGKPSFVAARKAYCDVRDQLEKQFGVIGNPYRTPEERKELYETFKEKLNDLAMTVFECDSQRMQSTVKPAAPSATGAVVDAGLKATDSVRLSLVPAPPKPPKPKSEKKLKVGSWAKKFLSVDFETRTITFKPGKEPITGKAEPLVISETAKKAWTILVELFTASSDTEGYVAINDMNRPWQTVLKQLVPKGRKEGIVDIYAPMTILRYHIHSEKKRGEPGHGRIRIQPQINGDLFRDEERRYKQWKIQHNG